MSKGKYGSMVLKVGRRPKWKKKSNRYQRNTGRERLAMATGKTFGGPVKTMKVTKAELAARYPTS